MIDRASAQDTSEFNGHIQLTGNGATSGTSWTYDVSNLSAVSGTSLTLTGDTITEPRSRSTTTESATLDLDPRGTSAPENATMRLTGVDNGSTQTRSGSLAPGGSDSITVGGDAKPTNASLTVSGSTTEINRQISGSGVSGSETFDGGSLGGGSGSVSVTVPGQPTTTHSISQNYYDFTSVDIGISTSTVDTVTQMQVDVQVYSDESPDYVFYLDGTQIGTYTGGFSDSYSSKTVSLDVPSISVGSSATLTVEETDANARGRITDSESHQVTMTGVDPAPATVNYPGGSQSFSSSGSVPFTASSGSNTVDISANGGVSWDIDWTERNGVEDPSVSVGSSTVSHNGVLDGSTTETVDLSTGSDTIDASYSGSGLSYDLSYETHEYPSDPTIQLDGGAATLTHTGSLDAGQTASKSISLSTGTHTADVSSAGPVNAEVVWDDVSETQNPTVDINGNTVAHSGTLSDGQTVDLSADVSDSWIQDGSNNVSVSMDGAGGGPSPQLGLSYSHDAETIAEISRTSSTWGEETDIHRQFAADQSGVSSEIPLPSNVVEIGTVEIDGSPISSDKYAINGTDLSVDIGDVVAGSSVDIYAKASKVRIQGGEVMVTDPTSEGDVLDTAIEVSSIGPDNDLRVDVGPTVSSDRIHRANTTSWGSEIPVRISADGSQELMLSASGASAGSTARITESSWSASIETGDIEVVPLTGETPIRDVEQTGSKPRIEVAAGAVEGDSASLTYHDAQSGEEYQLLHTGEDRVVQRATANSPVVFDVTDQSATLELQLAPLSSDALAVGGGGSSGDGLLPPWLLLLLGVGGAIGFLGLSNQRGFVTRSTVALGAGAVVIVALEVASPVSIIAEARWALVGITSGLIGAVAETGIAVAAGAIALLLAVWYVDGRTDRSIPLPIYLGSGALAVFWLVETVAPGAITEGRLPGVSEIGPLIWISIIGGSILLIYRWIGSRGTTVEIAATGGSSDD
jgi:hypothetical protein